MTEEWKTVPGFIDYEVSSYGQFRRATARIAEGCAESWKSTGKKPTRLYIDMTLWFAICREQFASVYGFSPTCRPSKDCRIDGMRIFLVDDPGHLAYAWCAEDERSDKGQNT